MIINDDCDDDNSPPPKTSLTWRDDCQEWTACRVNMENVGVSLSSLI